MASLTEIAVAAEARPSAESTATTATTARPSASSVAVLLPANRVPWESSAKACVDLCLSAVVLLLLAPLLGVLALAILIDDGRPVFYRTCRIGQHGRPFMLLKFRTMARDAEAQLATLDALNLGGRHLIRIPNDPRVTRVGRVLRRLSLDELPQFWNILRGDMSLVGPRPQSPSEVALYTIRERQRLRALPGLTGLWQVSARTEPDFAQLVECDLAYQEHWSIWLDIHIMLLTPLAMARGTGT